MPDLQQGSGEGGQTHSAGHMQGRLTVSIHHIAVDALSGEEQPGLLQSLPCQQVQQRLPTGPHHLKDEWNCERLHLR